VTDLGIMQSGGYTCIGFDADFICTLLPCRTVLDQFSNYPVAIQDHDSREGTYVQHELVVYQYALRFQQNAYEAFTSKASINANANANAML
jgi:hypothetical protein